MIRFVGRFARAALSGGLILTLVVGAPWLLVRFSGSPVPSRLPTMDSLQEWISQPNTSDHLLTIVKLVLWAGWALFTGVIAVEMYASIRRIRAPKIRLATPLHGVAAGLVGAATTALSSTAGHAAPPPAAPVDAAIATVPDHSGAHATAPSDAANPTRQEAAGRSAAVTTTRYRVAHGDWLVGIADRFLGDPNAYPRIAALNSQLAERDHRFPDHIEPGWIIALPPEAHDRGERQHATGTVLTPARTSNTSPSGGEHAQAPPSSPTRRTQSTPTQQHPTAAPTVSATPAASPVPVSIYPSADAETDIEGDAANDLVRPSKVGAMSGAGLLASLALLALKAERRRQTQHRRPGQRLPNPRGGTTERDLRVAEAPADVERLDVALRHLTTALAEHPTMPTIIGVRLVGGDVHLVLAGDAGTPPDLWLDEGDHWVLPASTPVPILDITERPLPTLTAIGSRAGRHLLLDLERHASLTITGDPERGLELLRYMVCELACNTWSEDAEITVAGFDDQQAAWLKQLNPGRVQNAESVTDAATRLRRHITATRRALDALDLPDTIHGRVRGIAVDAWTPHLLLVANPSEHDHTALTALHRDLAAGPPCGAALVVATPHQLAVGDAVITLATDAIATIVAPNLRASTHAAGLPATELEKVAEILRLARITELPADPDTNQTDIEPAHASTPGATPQEANGTDQTGPATADNFVRNLYDPNQWTPTSPPPQVTGPAVAASIAIQRATPFSVGLAGRDDSTLDTDLAAWTVSQADQPRVAVLGRVTVTTNGIPPEQRAAFYTEIAVYLAAHPRGADQWELADALWPDKNLNDKSVRVFTARVRKWLGHTPDGQPWLPDARDNQGRYQLRPGYLLDWHLLRRLKTRAQQGGPATIDDLRTALSLVRGRPLDGTDNPSNGRNQYAWLGQSDINPPHILAVIVDTAHQLAQLYLDQGDTVGARWAVHQAWTADPDRSHDEPWLDLMHAEQLDGNRAELRHLHDRLLHARDAEVAEDLAPATYRQLDKLLRA